MTEFYEFAGQHQVVVVLLAVIVASIPVSIIRALKNKDND